MDNKQTVEEAFQDQSPYGAHPNPKLQGEADAWENGFFAGATWQQTQTPSIDCGAGEGLDISPERAQYLLNVRDALVHDDILEAYHFLGKFYNPPMDKYSDELWKDIEEIAAKGEFEKYIPFVGFAHPKQGSALHPEGEFDKGYALGRDEALAAAGIKPLPPTSGKEWPTKEEIEKEAGKRFPIKDQRSGVFSSDNRQWQKQLAFTAAIQWLKSFTNNTGKEELENELQQVKSDLKIEKQINHDLHIKIVNRDSAKNDVIIYFEGLLKWIRHDHPKSPDLDFPAIVYAERALENLKQHNPSGKEDGEDEYIKHLQSEIEKYFNYKLRVESELQALKEEIQRLKEKLRSPRVVKYYEVVGNSKKWLDEKIQLQSENTSLKQELEMEVNAATNAVKDYHDKNEVLKEQINDRTKDVLAYHEENKILKQRVKELEDDIRDNSANNFFNQPDE